MKNQWLEDLEDKVDATLTELARLQKENASLRATVEKLEAASEDPEESGWKEERTEVRERVGRLVETLESTLDELG